MNIREKTAAVSTGLNLVLTIAKFGLFFATGSIAVLAEAWHSLTDIFTSMMVYFAVKENTQDKPAGEEGPPEAEVEGETKTPGFNFAFISYFNIEQWVSLAIGALIFIAGLGIMQKAFTATQDVIRQPLISGIIFLIFALASYIVYRFETSVGEKEGSVGLISDGMHSRANMTASLLAGFSLIIYHLGVNVDRLVGGVIALLVLSFSIETIANVITSTRKDKELVFRYKAHILVASLFNLETWKQGISFLDEQFNLNLAQSKVLRKVAGNISWVTGVIILLIYLSTAVYSLAVSQEGIIERFGKPINKGSPVQPGLHLKAPWPVDRIIKIDSRRIKSLNIGNVIDRNTFALLWTREHGAEEPFISGDNYYFYPYLTVHYLVKDIFDYRYRYDDVTVLIESQAYQIVSKYFAKKEFYEITTTMRFDIEKEVMKDLQEHLDQLECGVEILSVNPKDIHPPIFIAYSFEAVVAAYQEKQKKINYALGYQNKEIAENRGKAVREKESAKAYVNDKIGRAQGDAGRFLHQLPKDRRDITITKMRIFLQTMKEALKNKELILVDPETGVPHIWLGAGKAGKVMDIEEMAMAE